MNSIPGTYNGELRSAIAAPEPNSATESGWTASKPARPSILRDVIAEKVVEQPLRGLNAVYAIILRYAP
jgi:hypothetical protein